MTIPFKLTVFCRRDFPEGRRVTEFIPSIKELMDGEQEPALVFSENQDVNLRFSAPDGFRFTMDGLDIFNADGEQDEEGQTWLTPQGGRVFSLFEGQNFPLVPGYYIMTVTGEGKSWYSLVEVTPRFLEKKSWKDMKKELTKEIRHLSFDFMCRHVHMDRYHGNLAGMDSRMLLRFYIIDDMFPQVFRALEELAHTANSRIAWKHRFLSPRVMDSMQPSRIRVSGKEEGRYRPMVQVKEITWNVAENRFARGVLEKLEKSLRSFAGNLQRLIEETRGNNSMYFSSASDSRMEKGRTELETYLRRTRQLLSAVAAVTEAEWFRETKPTMPKNIPMQLFMDPRYGALYRLHKHLEHPEDSVFVSPVYLLQWKRTDKLYEMWCFLQFVKALLSSGWQMKEGPAVKTEEGRYRLDYLDAGTEIVLTRQGDMLRLAYDKDIPGSGEETDRVHNPLYTNTWHRRPDFRMDYYQEKAYMGSLVADFKYRDVYYLWQDKEKSASLRSQFNSYHDMNTRYYDHMSERESLMNARPVKEVWAVFPRKAAGSGDEDYSLRFVSLSPGKDTTKELAERLEEYIKMLKN